MKITEEKYKNGLLQSKITQELTMTEYLLMNDVHQENDGLTLSDEYKEKHGLNTGQERFRPTETIDEIAIRKSFDALDPDYKRREFDL